MTPISFDTAQAICKHALSTDTRHEVLTHFAITSDGKDTRLVATDTHRLAVACIQNSFKVKKGDTLVLNGGDPKQAFPNWQRVVPDKYTRRAVVDCGALLKMLKCVTPVAKDVASRVRLKFTDTSIVLSARDSDIGTVECTIPAKCENCGGFEIAFNCKYLEDCAKSVRLLTKTFKAWPIAFEMTENSRPAIIRPDDVDSYLEVLMPMALA